VNCYRVRRKADDRLMRFIGFFWPAFMVQYTTTYRLPFMKFANVCTPSTWEQIPAWFREHIILHEQHHVRQFKPWYGPWLVIAAQLLPLPIFFSGRWFVERRAMLDDIKRNDMDAEQAVAMLWKGYGWPWPPGVDAPLVSHPPLRMT
jgi:hypothetical protein